jgi:hypothetical protein
MTKQIFLPSRDRFTWVDDIDYDWLNQWRWRVNAQGYVIRSWRIGGQEMVVSMHREIMRPPAGFVIDHIDHNKLNNVRGNLRIATQQQNLFNRQLNHNSNTGFKGVSYKRGRWQARIQFNEQPIYLGSYEDLKTAALVYDCAAKILFGEYAYLNLSRDTASPEMVALVVKRLTKYGL